MKAKKSAEIKDEILIRVKETMQVQSKRQCRRISIVAKHLILLQLLQKLQYAIAIERLKVRGVEVQLET